MENTNTNDNTQSNPTPAPENQDIRNAHGAMKTNTNGTMQELSPEEIQAGMVKVIKPGSGS